jgi:hypothetical protein
VVIDGNKEIGYDLAQKIAIWWPHILQNNLL